MSMGASGESFENINITPLTDVFLVLLVIMILIAPLIDKSELKIKPPETYNAKKENSRTKTIMIDVDAEGRVAIQGKTLESNDEATIQNTLGGIIKNLGVEDMPVTVNADGNCKQKDIIAIMNACSQIGIKRMRVATIQTTNY
ncbi:MAG: biopolymer transporter ExbD [Cyanobacteriota/Melainabacteria group bacterium]|nr:biopolymer transporter ExbD [Cyanobacteria bacterium HKST-UBA01]MCB9470805.1 biopolymer transporter ExbD [Candidatus Obscuribacterales bacterium]HMO20859.1 biopolymer transporter ExbD [Candidatus Melainabacteria bacterium]